MTKDESLGSISRRFMEIELKALLNYTPQSIRSRVTLFRVRRLSLLRSYDPTMGWRELAGGGVEVRIIEGSHGNIIFRPAVFSLGEQLQESIERALHAVTKPSTY